MTYSQLNLLILFENIYGEKSHINEICEDCLKYISARFYLFLNWICLKITVYIFGKIRFVFKLDMFKNNVDYVLF
jgi:hypothetical protein